MTGNLECRINGLAVGRRVLELIPGVGETLWETFKLQGVADCTLMLSGNLAGPDTRISGTVQVFEGRLLPSFCLIPVLDVSARAYFDGPQVHVAGLSGRLDLTGPGGPEYASSPAGLTVRGTVDAAAQDGDFEFRIADLDMCPLVVEAIPGIGEVMWRSVRPRGMVDVSGMVQWRGQQQEDPFSWYLDLALKNASVVWTQVPISLYSLSGHVLVTKEAAVLSSITGLAATGRFSAAGRMVMGAGQEGMPYSGTVEFRQVELRRLLQELSEQDRPVSGRLSGIIEINGSAGDDSMPAGKGIVELSDGYLWEAPFFMGLVDVLHLSFPGGGKGLDSGSLRFSLKDGWVNVERFQVASRGTEVTGQGSVGMRTGDLKDATVVAATLPEGGLPLIGKALRIVLRPVERQLARFEVTGTVQDPKFRAVPWRALTSPVGSVFDLLTSPFRGEEKPEEEWGVVTPIDLDEVD